MPRKPKPGIDFAGWSVNMFDGDKKIDKLLDAQGWKGFGVYFFLCQSAYKLNGYYLEWGYDDSASTARRMGGGVTSQTVEETVRLCLRVGLFDEGLFDRWSVLTSKGIQKRFWVVAGERRVVPLHKKYWLLSPEEAEGLDKCARFDDLSSTNGYLSGTNADMSPTNVHRTIVEDTIVDNSNSSNNNTREDKSQNDLARVMTLYMNKIQAVPSGTAIDLLKQYTEELSGEVVCYAINSALDANVRNWKYIEAILRNYSRDGVKTIEAARLKEQEFQERKNRRRESNGNSGRDSQNVAEDSGTWHGYKLHNDLDE